MKNFPLLKTIRVNPRMVNFLNRKFEQYKSVHPSWEDDNAFQDSGYQTPNLLEWEDEEYQNYIKNGPLKRLVNSHISCEWEYRWNHVLDYDKGHGQMAVHNHAATEDFVVFIYLKTCKTGETVFYLNGWAPGRTRFVILPKVGLGAVFAASTNHEGVYTGENKRLFVCGVKLIQPADVLYMPLI